MTTRFVRLGDVLQLERIPVEISPDEEYVQIGIRSFGRGIFHREKTTGDKLSKLRYFKIVPDRLVVSNIMAWEGAIAVSTDQDLGCVGSNRFLSYAPSDEVDIRYLNYYFQSKQGQEAIRRTSTGTVLRNQTLSMKDFENLVVPLPNPDEQRRIAGILDRNLEIQETITESRKRNKCLAKETIHRMIRGIFERGIDGGWEISPLGDVAEINPQVRRPASNEIVAFVPMAAVNEATGTVVAPEYTSAGELRSGYKRFQRGDVIFARITPCMQNGKSAIFDDPSSEIGFGSTEFHVIRTRGDVLPEWIHRFVRTKDFRDQAMAKFVGTAGHQRVPADHLRTAPIPFPRTIREQRHTLTEIDHILNTGRRVMGLINAQESRLQDFRGSLLHAAFNGQL